MLSTFQMSLVYAFIGKTGPIQKLTSEYFEALLSMTRVVDSKATKYSKVDLVSERGQF